MCIYSQVSYEFSSAIGVTDSDLQVHALLALRLIGGHRA